MALVRFDVGQSADMLTPSEHSANLEHHRTSLWVERARGVKHMRMPGLQGTAVSSALLMGHGAQQVGPRDGFCWSVQRLVVNGLTTGATPDVVNFYFNNEEGVPAWQLNGNQFGTSFGKLQLTMYGGDVLIVQSVGTFNATGTITVQGEVIEVPSEMLWKLT
jgi:hypothetical protein